MAERADMRAHAARAPNPPPHAVCTTPLAHPTHAVVDRGVVLDLILVQLRVRPGQIKSGQMVGGKSAVDQGMMWLVWDGAMSVYAQVVCRLLVMASSSHRELHVLCHGAWAEQGQRVDAYCKGQGGRSMRGYMLQHAASSSSKSKGLQPPRSKLIRLN